MAVQQTAKPAEYRAFLPTAATVARAGPSAPKSADFTLPTYWIAERDRLPAKVQPHVERLAAISRDLRLDREVAFYGAEDRHRNCERLRRWSGRRNVRLPVGEPLDEHRRIGVTLDHVTPSRHSRRSSRPVSRGGASVWKLT